MQPANEEIYNSAFGVANSLLMLETRITDDALTRVLQTVLGMPQFQELDATKLRKILEANVNVHVGGYSVLDDRQFKAWISAKRESQPFQFWKRYSAFLEKKKRIPKNVLRQLDGLTDDILDRLRDPSTEGSWDRRGLVVGDVQSGKTSNYIGLVCKAVDAGYPLIIILAGVHNSLRSQTQIRVDEGFLGFDTRLNLVYGQENQRIGAGTLPEAPFLVAHSLTSSIETGDFRLNIAKGSKIIPGGKDPVVLVVKKHVSILKNLITWVLSVRGEANTEIPGSRIIRNVPLLLIDDEADHASANTNEFRTEDGEIDEESDPTRTNSLIRQLLSAFEKSAYVGYTATPFANVFMHHEARSNLVAEKLGTVIGDDLFPRSFIINIPAPSNYIGPEKVFGIERPGDGEESSGLPIIDTKVADAAAVFPPSHKKWHPVDELPASLRKAMLSFFLVCSARRARGDIHVHNSMLVHVTRFVMVQSQVAELLDEELQDCRRQLEYEGSGGTLVSELREIWERDFASKQALLSEAFPDEDLPPVEWEDVENNLFDAVKRISVRKINGTAKEALDYTDHPQGLSIIAVGGDKLSRGLTLEGLSISYFLRTTRMYDTLMQMGRWFGYRPRYADLCRLFTSPELVEWYRHIASATAELRDEFDYVIDIGGDPLQFGNRVRTHPDGLLITAANKMRASTKIRAGFSGTISETVAFDLKEAKANHKEFSDFVSILGERPLKNGRYVWESVDGQRIAALMRSIRTPKESWKTNSQALAQYIEDRVRNGRLNEWTVALMASGQAVRPDGEPAEAVIGGLPVRLTKRENRAAGGSGRYAIGRLVSPADEELDLTAEKRSDALDATINAWLKKKEPKGKKPEAPSGPYIRQMRSRQNGLLLIYPIEPGESASEPLMGFALSFPFDRDAKLIEYAENSVKQLELIFE